MKRDLKTLREIYKQPEVWQTCLHVLDGMNLESLVRGNHPRTKEWVFVGCGTSD
jgi:fructoselysine-6-P-deglycase FrlB-like protein